MTDTNDTKDRNPGSGPRTGAGTLSVKRPAAEQGRPRQGFHSRTKAQFVVETKKKRPLGPSGREEERPVAAEAKPAFQAQPKVAQAEKPRASETQQARSGVVLRTLTAEEKEARDRALADSRLRDAEERRESEERRRQEEESRKKRDFEERERKDREAAARRKSDEETRHRQEEEAKRKAEETAKKLAPKLPAQTAEEEEAPVRTSRVKRELKAPPAPAKTKAEAEKRRGKLTLSNALSEEDERTRSVAAFRRRTERLKKQAQGFQKPTEKIFARSHHSRGDHHPGTCQPHGRTRGRHHQAPDEAGADAHHQ